MNKRRIFISYKTGADDGNNFIANTVHHFLESEGYDVWRDEQDMVAGEAWNSQIYENISKSDLVVLLLTPPVIDSNWVQREVDFARGARVFTLPIRTRGTDEEIQAVLSKLELAFTQYMSFNQGNEAQKRTPDRPN